MGDKQTIAALKKKNKDLEEKLEHASDWMQKSVAEKKGIIDGDIEEVNVGGIKEKVAEFLGNYPLSLDEENIMDDLISSEILFYHIQQSPDIDGTGAIIGYNKVLDYVVEKYISSPFRKFAHTRCKNILTSSNHIEKNLHMTVHKGYMLSIGRLFEVLEVIKNDYKKEFYVDLFEAFLDEYAYVKEVLLSDEFYYSLKSIVDKEIFGSKRHSGSVSFEDTREVREKVVGNLENKNCLFISLLKLGETP